MALYMTFRFFALTFLTLQTFFFQLYTSKVVKGVLDAAFGGGGQKRLQWSTFNVNMLQI